MIFETRPEDYSKDRLERFLETRNVQNIELFLNPLSYKEIEKPFAFRDMQRAVLMFISHYNVGNKIGVLVDSDADGYTSAAMLVSRINKLEKSNVVYFLHEKKKHGLHSEIFEEIVGSDIDLLIIPDAASNDLNELFQLIYNGIDVIVLDHHEIEEKNYIDEIEGLCIVNTKSKYNPDTNKELTGVGMVYQFLKGIDIALNTNEADNYLDLMAVGQISDSSDIVEPYIRKKVFLGLNNIKNPLLQMILDKEIGKHENVTPNDISFKISPYLNAVCRVGDIDERGLLFSSLSGINLEDMEVVEKKKKNKETGKFEKYEIALTKTELCFDMLKKVKARQAALVKKSLTYLQNTSTDTNEDFIGIFKLEDGKAAAITGLIAMKLSEQKQKPCIVIHEDSEGVWKGSGRGYEAKVKSLREWCQETKLFNLVQGHDNAFGVEITDENLKKLEIENRNVCTICAAEAYMVDILQSRKVEKEEVKFFTDNIAIFGGSVTEALIGFENIKVPKRFINVRGSMVSFFAGGMEFVSYNTPQEKIDLLTKGLTMDYFIDFVGSPSISSFGKNKGEVQIILRDFEVFQADKFANMKVEEISEKEEEITVENIVF